MARVKLQPSCMGQWLLISAGSRIARYKPACEDICLKNENSLKFEDEVYIIPSSAIEVTLHWVGNDLVKVRLDTVIYLNYGERPIEVIIKWFFDTEEPECRAMCKMGREDLDLNTDGMKEIIKRVSMLINKFPSVLKKHISEPLSTCRFVKSEPEQAGSKSKTVSGGFAGQKPQAGQGNFAHC